MLKKEALISEVLKLKADKRKLQQYRKAAKRTRRHDRKDFKELRERVRLHR